MNLALCIVGYICGWIVYDTIFAQLAAVAAVRLARTHSLLAAVTATCAFLVGFVAAFLSHVLQVALFYGSMDQAISDILGEALFRLRPVETWQGRLYVWLPQLARDYWHAVWLPEWTHLESLLLALSLWGLTCWYQADGWALRVVCIPPLSVAAWFVVAPAYSAPHLHLFPRLILFGPLTVLVCAVPMAGGSQ